MPGPMELLVVGVILAGFVGTGLVVVKLLRK
jgi:hypothetical protein